MPPAPVAPPAFRARLATVLAGELTGKLATAGAFIWVARTLDPSAYGQVEWALSLTTVFTLVVDAGLTSWAAARVAARPDDAGALVARVSALRLTLAVPAYLVLLAVAWLRGGPAGTALAVYGLTLFFTPFFLQYLFNGLFRPGWAAIGQTVRGLAFAATVLVLVRAGAPPVAVATAEVVAVVALAVYGLVAVRGVLRLPIPVPHAGLDLRGLFASSWPVGAAELSWGVHWYAGLIVLGYLTTPTDTAWHSAGLRLVLAIHTLVWLYLYVLLPSLARAASSNYAQWAPLLERSLRVSGLAGLAIAVVVTAMARPILTTLFGEPFAASVPALRATIWVIPIAWMSGHVRYSLIAAGHPWRDCQAAIAGATTTIVLTLALVPTLRSTGAGVALVGGTAANAIVAWILARGVMPPISLARSGSWS